jgi:hypothetical protein
MKEDEDIAAYFLPVIVQRVLRSLPMRFDPKISSLEEITDLAMLSM